MIKYLIVALMLILFFGCNLSDSTVAVNYSKETIKNAVPFAEGIISTKEDSEFAIMFSADGRTAYFSRRAPEQKQKIYQSQFDDGNWTIPKLADFSTDRDEEPSITPDGKYFFFGSERPIPGKVNKGNFDMNIWMMKQEKNGWSNPEPIPFPINDVQIEGEEWPSSNNNFLFAVDNETFYFTTMFRGSKSIKLYQTQFVNNKFSVPKEIKGLFEDDKFWIYSAVVSPNGKYLVFNSYGAPGGSGGEDIFVSKRVGKDWSLAKPIGPKVNSKNEESGPRFSRDGKYFFFTRAEVLGEDMYSEWDILFLETEYLNLDQLFE